MMKQVIRSKYNLFHLKIRDLPYYLLFIYVCIVIKGLTFQKHFMSWRSLRALSATWRATIVSSSRRKGSIQAGFYQCGTEGVGRRRSSSHRIRKISQSLIISDFRIRIAELNLQPEIQNLKFDTPHSAIYNPQ
jgi:hypothetical protein